jgi:hypothetical protein
MNSAPPKLVRVLLQVLQAQRVQPQLLVLEHQHQEHLHPQQGCAQS